MKLNFSSNAILNVFLKYLRIFLYIINIIILIFLAFIFYTNVYQNIIVPKDINESEIISKKQTINIDLFETINDNITVKQSAPDLPFAETPDPFQ